MPFFARMRDFATFACACESPSTGCRLEMYGMRYRIFPFLLLTVVLMCSCRHHPTMREMGIVLDTLKASGGIALTDSAASPRCTADIELITLSNEEYAPLCDSLLRSGILSPEYLSLTERHIPPREAVDSFIKRYCSDYRTFYSGLFTDECDTAAATIGFKLRTDISEGRDSTLMYRAHITNRQGAVTTEYTVCQNLDLPRKRILRLEDLFVPGYEKGLTEAITAQLMKQSSNKSLAELHEAGFFNGIEAYPTSNFLLDNHAITFVYVAGEIADRDKGEIQVEVKLSNVKQLLKR